MATLQGVYSASVLDNRDPDNLGRVLVRVPGVTERETDVWARVATMMAGRNRGTWFIPEVGDEVLVAFEHGDVRTAYVIGALWNARSRPPVAGNADDAKLIRTRSGMTVRIQDNSNSLVLETAAGQRITLQDGPDSVRIEDSSGNSVKMESSGVTVTASAKLTVNAATLELSAAMVTVTAGMSRFSGVVQCDTLITNSVVSASYTPGSGNIW